MDGIQSSLDELKADYDKGESPIAKIFRLTQTCIEKLNREARIREQVRLCGKPYFVYMKENIYSRPVSADLYTPNQFPDLWREVISSLNPTRNLISCDIGVVDKVLYTTITSLACCYDLWQKESRKTPGTYFEVVLGSLMAKILPAYTRTKHIPIAGARSGVSTDIVFKNGIGRRGIVIPAKITTRERIVQAFAHQRILDSVFGEGSYISILMCASEMQRDKTDGVKEVCVPGTIKLFQNYLAKLGGIYYLDPPQRYLKEDLKGIIIVSSTGDFFCNRLPELVSCE